MINQVTQTIRTREINGEEILYAKCSEKALWSTWAVHLALKKGESVKK